MEDPLFEAQRSIARRADELVRLSGGDHEQALIHWHQAEREFWQQLQGQASAEKQA